MQCLILMGFQYSTEVAHALIRCCWQSCAECSGNAPTVKADTIGVGVPQVQANVQTVLEGLGLVENKTAKQDAAALKEVSLHFACQRRAVTWSNLPCVVSHLYVRLRLLCMEWTLCAVATNKMLCCLQVQSILKPTQGVTWASGKPENEGGYGAIFLED